MNDSPIYGFKNANNTGIMFRYRTNQGNEKKAFFTRKSDAEMVLKRYIRDYRNWEIVVIAEEYKQLNPELLTK